MGCLMERAKTKNTPYVLIDEDRGYMRMEGESYLEDIMGFFREIVDWLEAYLVTDFEQFTFDCELQYFNSSTTKLLHNMFRAMDRSAGAGKKVIVNWIAADDDEMNIECGEDFREEMEKLEFNLVIKPNAV